MNQNTAYAHAAPARPNQAGRPTAAELERRKARVMQVATELFVANGYAGTSLIDIARGAGVATRTLYQHFGDKEALFREVIYARDTAAVFNPPRLKEGDTLTEALHRCAGYALEVMYRPQSLGLMRLMIAEAPRFPAFIKNVANVIYTRFRRNVERLFSDLGSAGMIPDHDHARSAELFLDLIFGSGLLMVYADWRGSRPSAEDVAERIEFFIRGRFGGDVPKG